MFRVLNEFNEFLGQFDESVLLPRAFARLVEALVVDVLGAWRSAPARGGGLRVLFVSVGKHLFAFAQSGVGEGFRLFAAQGSCLGNYLGRCERGHFSCVDLHLQTATRLFYGSALHWFLLFLGSDISDN